MNEMKEFIESILGTGLEKFEYEAGGYERIGWKKRVEWKNRSDNGEAVNIVDSCWRACHERDVRLLVGPNVHGETPEGHTFSWGVSNPNALPRLYAQIFALPQLPVLDVIELFAVGSHDDVPISGDFMEESLEMLERQMGAEQRKWLETPEGQKMAARNRMMIEQMCDGTERWKKVRTSLGEVLRIEPFEIQSADEAHLQATFLNPVTKPPAKRIGKIILDLNSDIFESLTDDLDELGIPVPMDLQSPEIPDYEAVIAEIIAATGKFKLWWD